MNVCGERLRALRESMNYSQMKSGNLTASPATAMTAHITKPR